MYSQWDLLFWYELVSEHMVLSVRNKIVFGMERKGLVKMSNHDFFHNFHHSVTELFELFIFNILLKFSFNMWLFSKDVCWYSFLIFYPLEETLG